MPKFGFVWPHGASSEVCAAAVMEDNQFFVDSVVRGHHVYKDRCAPMLKETSQCFREVRNREDHFAIAVYEDEDIVSPISMLCSIFLRQGGTIRCVVSGNCQYSCDFPQGGELAVPCKLYFIGNSQELKKI